MQDAASSAEYAAGSAEDAVWAAAESVKQHVEGLTGGSLEFFTRKTKIDVHHIRQNMNFNNDRIMAELQTISERLARLERAAGVPEQPVEGGIQPERAGAVPDGACRLS